VVGDLYNIEYEKLLTLRPTHVIVQAVKQQPIPERLRDLAERHDWKLASYPIETAADVGRIVRELGQLLDTPDEAAALARRTDERIAAITELTAERPRPRTLLVVGFSPLTAVAPGTFLDEMLQAAGGRNVLEKGGMLYPVLDRERLIALDPQVIVLITPDAGSAAAGDAPTRDPLAALKLPEAMKPRIVQLTDPTALLPSTSMPRIAAGLARGLHPELADRVDKIVPR
jgi:ABC-type Fe3+-hydroxamate transport system substrate-binding protein